MTITSEVTPREFHDLPEASGSSSVADLRIEANSLVPAELVSPTTTQFLSPNKHPALRTAWTNGA